MLYKFKSQSTGDVLMLGPDGDEILRIIGKAPAGKGILQTADLPAAIAALQSAIASAESQPAQTTAAINQSEPDDVSLRQRAWPWWK